jgi:hypothetical protein
MYSRPAVPDKTILLSLSKRLIPIGPIIAPAIMRPRRWGILILLSRIGASRITVRISKNSKTGFLIGNVVSNIFSNN